MAEMHPICPVCEAGTLSPTIFNDLFHHNGFELRVDGLEGYVCESCGADPVFEDQIRRNHRRIVDAKRAADGLLTGKEIRELRKRFGLTQKEASELFGGGANAFSKYERGDVVQSGAMDRLLRMVARHPDLLYELREGEEPTNEGIINAQNGYVNGNPIKMNGAANRSPVCYGKNVVVEIDDWKRKHAA